MNNDNLQRLAQDAHIEQSSSTPDFRFTNYAFAQQNLNEKPLPQNPSNPSGKPATIFVS
jgi:hypothetical protein